MHDFQDILIREGNRCMLSPWHDVAISLHGDWSLRQPQVIEQASNRQPLGNGMLIAVDCDSHDAPKDTSAASDAPAAYE